MKALLSDVAVIAKEASMELNPDSAARTVCEKVFEALNLHDLVLYMKHSSTELRQEMAIGVKGSFSHKLVKNPLILPFGRGVVGSVAISKEMRNIPDVSEIDNYVVDIAGCNSELATPLVYKGKLVGVLDSEHPKKNFFTKSHEALFQVVATILSPLIYEITTPKKNIFRGSVF